MTGDEQNPKLLFTVAEAGTALGVGRTMLYNLMATGRLRPVHIGRLTRFTAAELHRFVGELHSVESREVVYGPGL